MSQSPLLGDPEKTNAFFRTEIDIMWNMAWPSVVSGFCRSAMISIEGAFVGHITNGDYSTEEYLSAASLTFMASGITFMVPVAFIVGLSPLVGQAVGAGNKAMAGTWLQLSVFWALIGSIPSIAVLVWIEDVLSILNFPPSICTLAGQFGPYIVPMVIPRIVLSCCSAFFRALKLAKFAMYSDAVFMVVHVLVNWVLVFGGPLNDWLGWHGLGFIGAAVAISVTRSLEAFTYLMYMFVWRRAHSEFWPGWNLHFLHREPMSKFAAQCFPQMGSWILQGVMDQAASFMMTSLGVTAIAVNSAVSTLSNALTQPLSRSLVPVMGARVGFYLGAGDGDSARRAASILFGGTLLLFALISAILIPFGDQAMSVVTSDVEVRALSCQLLPALLLSQLFGVVRMLNSDGVLASQRRTRLVAQISMGFETPLSLGGVAVAIFYLRFNLLQVYWCQVGIAIILAAVGTTIIVRSDWQYYATQVQLAQVPKESKSDQPTIIRRRSTRSTISFQVLDSVLEDLQPEAADVKD